MGTRGLRIIVFRGRYFVYYNQYDSYLEGLGRELVDRIPTDPEQYKEWLESERAFYARLTAELESRVLTVPEDKMRELLAEEQTAYEEYEEYEEYERSEVHPIWKEIDSELEQLPTALCDAGNDLMIEWSYVIDLDSELFSVDNWIFFDLWDIPRDRWIQAFEFEDQGRKVFSFEICPEGSSGVVPTEYFANDVARERDKYHAIFQHYSNSLVEATSSVDASSRAALQQIVAITLFEKLTGCYYSWKYLATWGHEDFAFREAAFAILSFATGQFYFDDPNRFYGGYDEHESNGYLIDRNEGGEPKLMPIFGSGCHQPDTEPGSAPASSIYWFENVLISLVPNTVFEKDAEAAIAKAVEYGIEEGKVNFQIVLFSIQNAIMLEVQVQDGVKVIRRTRVVSIFDASRMNGRDEDDQNDNCDNNAASQLEKMCRKHSGFVSLQNFFHTAANRHLSVFSRGRFPVEIYAKIIASADSSTHNACAKVSRIFHALCQERFFFSNNLTILKFEASTSAPGPQDPSLRLPWINLEDLGIFTFQDQKSGHIMRSTLSVRHQVRIADEKMVTTWCPVVGGVARQSMMTGCRLRVFLRP